MVSVLYDATGAPCGTRGSSLSNASRSRPPSRMHVPLQSAPPDRLGLAARWRRPCTALTMLPLTCIVIISDEMGDHQRHMAHAMFVTTCIRTCLYCAQHPSLGRADPGSSNSSLRILSASPPLLRRCLPSRSTPPCSLLPGNWEVWEAVDRLTLRPTGTAIALHAKPQDTGTMPEGREGVGVTPRAHRHFRAPHRRTVVLEAFEEGFQKQVEASARPQLSSHGCTSAQC
ncbi:hypothetical protein G7046_g7579 [Stylonectria norvegica]|nr:hypothetical protein G7046_g7579 [Stylonectria norvegica]